MELKADDIITAMECHRIGACDKCPYQHIFKCLDYLCDDAVSLVKKLGEENERLRAEKETLEIYNKDYKYKNKELTAFNRRWAKECADLQDECEHIKADTVRKMQERLKAQAIIIKDHTGKMGTVVGVGNIDDVAREMLEGKPTAE